MTEQRNSEFDPEYHHSDKTTEHLLNYIAGQESLTQEERFDIARQLIKEALKDQDANPILLPQVTLNKKPYHPVLLPADYDTMPRERLVTVFSNEIEFTREKPLPKGMTREEYGARVIRELESWIPESYEFDRKTYEELWKIERKAGAPNIRWMYPV